MELFHLYLFVTVTNVVDPLNPIFFLVGECHPLFPPPIATHNLQFPSVTVPLNFVWLSHYGLSFTIASFSKRNCLIFLCVNVTQIPCVSSPLSLCECHTCASPFSMCECHTIILVSITFKWALHLLGHNWPIRVLNLCGLPHLIFFFFWLKNPLVLPLQFWYYNEIIYNNFHISNVIVYLQFLVFFFRFLRSI